MSLLPAQLAGTALGGIGDSMTELLKLGLGVKSFEELDKRSREVKDQSLNAIDGTAQANRYQIRQGAAAGRASNNDLGRAYFGQSTPEKAPSWASLSPDQQANFQEFLSSRPGVNQDQAYLEWSRGQGLSTVDLSKRGESVYSKNMNRAIGESQELVNQGLNRLDSATGEFRDRAEGELGVLGSKMQSLRDRTAKTFGDTKAKMGEMYGEYKDQVESNFQKYTNQVMDVVSTTKSKLDDYIFSSVDRSEKALAEIKDHSAMVTAATTSAIKASAQETMATLSQQITAPPNSPEYHRQLRQIQGAVQQQAVAQAAKTGGEVAYNFEQLRTGAMVSLNTSIHNLVNTAMGSASGLAQTAISALDPTRKDSLIGEAITAEAGFMNALSTAESSLDTQITGAEVSGRRSILQDLDTHISNHATAGANILSTWAQAKLGAEQNIEATDLNMLNSLSSTYASIDQVEAANQIANNNNWQTMAVAAWTTYGSMGQTAVQTALSQFSLVDFGAPFRGITNSLLSIGQQQINQQQVDQQGGTQLPGFQFETPGGGGFGIGPSEIG